MLVRDLPALPPSLYGRVVRVAEGASKRSNAAAVPDELNVVVHTQYVRTCVHPVNVEMAGVLCDTPYVSDSVSIGSRLREMLKRSGRSMAKVAKAAGYTTTSGVQRFFDDAYDPGTLPVDIARKLAEGFSGTSVTRDEVFALADLPAAPEVAPFKFEGAADVRLARDLPIFGTALGAPREIDGVAIEQTFLDESSVVEYLPRPTVLQGRSDVYGFYIQGSSMAPRFEEGEVGFAESKRPPRVGDDVVVYLRVPDDHDGDRVSAVLIKRLVRRTAEYVELEQFNPARTFRVDKEKVSGIHRVLPWREILS